MPWRGRSGASKWHSAVLGFHFLLLWDLSLYTPRNAAYVWTVALGEEVGFLFHLPRKCSHTKKPILDFRLKGSQDKVCACVPSCFSHV